MKYKMGMKVVHIYYRYWVNVHVISEGDHTAWYAPSLSLLLNSAPFTFKSVQFKQ